MFVMARSAIVMMTESWEKQMNSQLMGNCKEKERYFAEIMFSSYALTTGVLRAHT